MIRVWEKVNNISFDNVSFNPTNLDAFGRLRISDMNTLLDVTHTNDKNELVIAEKVNGTATSTHDPNASHVLMTVNNNGDYVIRQSRKYCVYQPGKSLLVELTGVLITSITPNVVSRMGYFDSDDGIFLEYNSGTINIVKRSSASGSPVETRIDQSNWNLNTLLVDSSSSYILNPTKCQIFLIDFQWLGVGRVRCGFVHEGKIVYVHQFVHDNITTQVYMKTANLPVRYEISSNGGGATMCQICSTVVSEGGYSPVNLSFSVGTGTLTKSVGGTEYPLIGIRLKSGKRTNILPGDVSVTTSSNDYFQYFVRLYRSPGSSPLTDGSWTNIHANSSVQSNITATTFTTTNSIIISQGYYSGKNTKELASDLTYAFSGYNVITTDIDGNSDYLIVSAIKLGGGAGVNTYASIEWREIF